MKPSGLNIILLFNSESFLNATSTVVSPGSVTLQIKCTVSLFDIIEQLYGMISPGQLISPLDTTGGRGVMETDANVKHIMGCIEENIMYIPVTRVQLSS